MKTFALFSSFFFLLTQFSIHAQNLFYRHNGSQIKVTKSEKKYVIQTKNGTNISNLKDNPSIDSLKQLTLDQNLYLIFKNNRTTDNLLQESNFDTNTIGINPVLITADGKELGFISEQIIVRLKPSTQVATFEDIIRKHDARIDRKTEYDSLTYIISTLADTDRIFELTEKLYQSQIFEYVEPKFWLFIETASSNKKSPIAICTNDQYYPQQWHLNNTGQSGGIVDADIDAPEAWAITTGSASVRIAILDNGTERNHPDLTANISGGFDATSGSGGCGYPATLGNPNWCAGDAHGTWVAGVAAAVGCTGIGVTGVAYGSKIVPVRVFQGTTLTNADWVASGINYARNNSEIINMSFTLTGPSSTVDTQISQAVTTGRGGKGVILVAASGNNAGSTPGYPSINQNVVSVGRTTNQEMRFMDSQYGPGLDLVAPGVDIWTTDLTGATGANTGDYAAVGGTSFASAAVSGAFALVLSVNPNLTINQARMLLESTTDKISLGTYSYASTPNQNNGAWNNEVGYGRLNVNNTLIAMRNSNITGPSTICTSGTFNLTFKPNVPKTWYSSNTSILTINSVSGVATRVGSGSGPVTITMRYSVLSTTYDITKEIWVGTPDVSTIKYDNGISAGGGNYVTPYSNHTVYLDQQNVIKANVTNTNWNPNPNIGYGYGMGFSQFDFSLDPGSTVVFNPVSSTNMCGTANRSLSFTANSSFMLAPNPATTELKIMFDNVEREENIPAIMTLVSESTLQAVKTVTRDQTLKQENIKSTKTFIINVADLPRGVYYFQAKQDLNSNNETKSVRVLLK